LIRGATAGLIATVILGTTGCKTLPFELPKPTLPTLAKPDLSKLAFWKSENLVAKKGNIPKPPSLSFDSSPIKQAVASTSNSASAEIESLRGQIASTKAQLTEPIREPYKYAAKSTAEKLTGGKIDLNSGSSSRNALAKTGSKITQAQKDFQAALAGSSKAIDKSIDKSIGGKVAGLKAAGNDFSLPKSIKIGKTNVDDSLMAVNKSLYNAQGNLASASNDVLKGAAQDNELSMFEKRLQQGVEKAKALPAQIASSGSSSKSASNAFGGVAPPKPLLIPTKPAKNSFAGSSSSNLPTTTTPSATAGVSSEVAELKAQLAQLRSDQQKLIQQQQQLAASQPSTSVQPAATTPISRQPNPSEFVANLTARPAPSYPQMYPSTAPLRTANSSNNVSSNAPQNVLRGNFSPVASSTPQYPSYPTTSVPSPAPQPTAYPDSKYSSTPHTGYGAPVNKYSNTAAPTYAPASRDTQASFQQHGNSNLVISASTPVEPARQHVSEVNIPDAVLQGTSSYAPGTVHALR